MPINVLVRGIIAAAVVSAGFMGSAEASPTAKWVQLGIGTSHSIMSTTGVKTTMTEPALTPVEWSGSRWRYYWVGTTMRDGVFFQAGYSDPPLDSMCASLEWFVWAFDSMGGVISSTAGGCGLGGSRGFALRNTGYSATMLGYQYRAMTGGAYIGPSLYSDYAGFAVNRTGAISEISSDSVPVGSLTLPAVTYAPALQVLNSSGSYIDTLDGHVTRIDGLYTATPCPPYAIYINGPEDVTIKSAFWLVICLAQGASLW
jgi:hypothetical protein